MKYIVANWKQHKNEHEAVYWLQQVHPAASQHAADIAVIVAAPYTLLPVMRERIDISSLDIGLAAQNISQFSTGAYTGEIGGEQLKSLVNFCIIGHSERRMYFGENNDAVAAKVQRAVEADIRPFVCIADQVRKDGTVPVEKIEVDETWFSDQVSAVFSLLDASDHNKVTLVYEPISAISTFGGTPLTADQCAEHIATIQGLVAEDIAIMYGGSVNPENIHTYWDLDVVAGVMPGGASLQPENFIKLFHRTE